MANSVNLSKPASGPAAPKKKLRDSTAETVREIGKIVSPDLEEWMVSDWPKPKGRRFKQANVASAGSISASKAKAHLLELLDTVDSRRESLVITKRGRAVARLVPIEEQQPKDIFGCMKGTFRVTGDIVGAEPDHWEAMS